MLDTNICIYALNHRPAGIRSRLESLSAERVCLSSITAAELAFGAEKSGRPETAALLETFLGLFTIAPWDREVIWQYGRIRWALEREGQRIGERDQLIAAHACALDAILVTNNVREFQRVPGLSWENWAESR